MRGLEDILTSLQNARRVGLSNPITNGAPGPWVGLGAFFGQQLRVAVDLKLSGYVMVVAPQEPGARA